MPNDVQLYVKNLSKRMHVLHRFVPAGVEEPITEAQLIANAKGIATIVRYGEIKVFAKVGSERHELSADDVEEYAAQAAKETEPAPAVAGVSAETKAQIAADLAARMKELSKSGEGGDGA